jgi:hypothetical protein
MSPTKLKQEFITAFALSLSYWALLSLASGLFQGGFQLRDDIILADFFQRLQSKALPQLYREVISADLSIRFRPLTMLHFMLMVKAYQLNYTALLWHNLLIVSAACAFFHISVRRIGFSRLQAFLFVAILFLGNQGVIGIRLVLAENLGMLFLSLCMWQLVNGKSLTATLFFTLSALSKESFVLLAPAILWGDFLLSGESNLKSYIAKRSMLVASISLASMAILAVIIFRVGTNAIGYAGVDAETLSPWKLTNTALRLLFTKGYLLTLIPAAFLLRKAAPMSTTAKNEILRIAILCALIAIPQITLYAKSQIFMHYLMPGMLWSAFAVVLFLKFLESTGSRPGPINLFSVSVVSLLAINATLLFRNAKMIAREGREARMAMEAVAEKTRRSESILIIGHPVRDYERAHDAAGFLSSYLYQRDSVSILPSTGISAAWNGNDSKTAEKFFLMNRTFIQRREDIIRLSGCILFMPGTLEETRSYSPVPLDLATRELEKVGPFTIATPKPLNH